MSEEDERKWTFLSEAPPRHIPFLAPFPVPNQLLDQTLSQTPGMAFKNLHLFVTWLSFTEHWHFIVLKQPSNDLRFVSSNLKKSLPYKIAVTAL